MGTAHKDKNDKKTLLILDKKANRIIESALDAVIIINTKGVIINWNQQATKIFGFSSEEVLDKTLSDFIIPHQYRKAHHSGMQHYLKTGEGPALNTRIEITGLRKSGEEFPIELAITPIKLENETIFSAFLRDISDRKKIELDQKNLNKELEKVVAKLEANARYLSSINKFSALILEKNNIDEIIWEVTRLIINELGFEDCVIYLFDKNKENLVQKAAFGPKKAEDNSINEPIIIPLGQGIVGTVAQTGVYEMISDTSLDPRYIVDDAMRFSELAVPIIADGDVIGVIDSEHSEKNFYSEDHVGKLQTVSGLVATRLKNAIYLEQLKQTQDILSKLSVVVEQSPLSTIITDPDGIIEFVNPAFERISGYTAKESIGHKTSLLNSGEHGQKIYQDLWNTIKSGNKWSSELVNKKKSGEKYWVLVSISPIKNQEGVITNFVAMETEITNLKRLETDLINAKEKAEGADKAKSVFLANMSHEIRTPMNAVFGMVKLLQDTAPGPKMDELRQRLLSSSHSMIEVINDILDFSKIESGVMVLDQSAFSLEKLLMEIKDSMEFKANEKKIELRFEMESPIKSYLMGDAVRLKQVLTNLTNNAIKFTHKGFVTISCKLISNEAKRAKIFFVVEDTGIGIEQKHIHSIFESFVQEDSSTTRIFGGTGLGLPISKQIVKMMGGNLEVTSKKGSGSRFYFTVSFDKTDDRPKKKETSQLAMDSETLKGVEVLLVEDNPMNQFVAKSILERWNVACVLAENGKIALDILKKRSFDLILMDKQMPTMDGIEASKIIRNTLKLDTPIIALSANVVKEVIEQFYMAGMNDYLSKPFEPIDLFTKMYQQLNLEPKPSSTLPKAADLDSEAPKEQDKYYDLEVLSGMLAQDENQINKMIDKFIEMMPEYLSQLEKSFEDADPDSVKRLAHKIKSSIDLVASTDIKDLIKLIHDNSNNMSSLKKIRKPHRDFQKLMRLMLDQMQHEKRQ